MMGSVRRASARVVSKTSAFRRDVAAESGLPQVLAWAGTACPMGTAMPAEAQIGPYNGGDDWLNAVPLANRALA